MGFRGRKLDITPSELMELRNQGYSNSDIAQMLDISKTTVQRYIGKQGCHMGHLAAFEDKPKNKAVVAPAEPAIPPYVPTLVTEQYVIGDCEEQIGVEINHECETMKIDANGGDILITFDQVR